MGYFAYIRCTGYNKQKLAKEIQIWYLPSELKEENYFYHDDIIMTSSKFWNLFADGVVRTPPNNNFTWFRVSFFFPTILLTNFRV
jgi:hypothetical protein